MSEATDRSGPNRPPDPGGDGGVRWRAILAGLLLLLAGAALGVTVDRLWVDGSTPAAAEPLTADALARSLELSPDERARVRAVLDSLRDEVAAAAAAGPDSLRAAARAARHRLHDALPPEHRPAFRRWIQHRHRQMMERMHPEGPHPMRGPGMRMHRGDSMHRGMMQ